MCNRVMELISVYNIAESHRDEKMMAIPNKQGKGRHMGRENFLTICLSSSLQTGIKSGRRKEVSFEKKRKRS